MGKASSYSRGQLLKSSTAFENDIPVTDELIEEYLAALRRSERSEDTLRLYRLKLHQMYRRLPEDHRIRQGTLDQVRRSMSGDYAYSTLNVLTTVMNGFVDYCGHREFQIPMLPPEDKSQPELTRNEYLRLLGTAKNLGKERLYLLVKLFACTGISYTEIGGLAVENVKEGRVVTSSGEVHIPSFICDELLGYALRNGIVSGYIFCTRSGKEIDRSNLNREIKELGDAAHIGREKCSPRVLRKLYTTAQEEIRENINALVEQASDQMLEKEQMVIGWK